jgi:hypothetical protein
MFVSACDSLVMCICVVYGDCATASIGVGAVFNANSDDTREKYGKIGENLLTEWHLHAHIDR